MRELDGRYLEQTGGGDRFPNRIIHRFGRSFLTTFGFKLFTFQVYRCSRQKVTKFQDCEGEHYRDILLRLLKGLSSSTSVGDPTLPDEERSTSKDIHGSPAFRVDSAELKDNTIRAVIQVGKFGSHENAIGAGDPAADIPIGDKAASNIFRIVFAIPDEGESGFLAVETIGRSCPHGLLIKWLKRKSQQEAATPEGEGVWWRPSVKAIADEERLAHMINEGAAQKLVLVRHAVGRDGIRKTNELVITESLAASGKLDQVSQMVRGWFTDEKGRASRLEESVTREAGVRELAAIVGPEIENIALDDGWVEIKDPDGQIKRVSPHHMADVFTYRLSEDRPVVTPTFYTEVRSVAMSLQTAAKLAFDWPTS
ncbi:hypothetical protein [Streptomyces sp. SPB4]|uniref:hypothetical protein n=1 Tax=Streptomyces sp. SPB4 TaxID=2940553 RepID=UPI002473F78C|nr:hypothetical protein [Streptomyces sp. SPB4]MDH6542031.1 hypothetical protein [Streptomyces sp. SPB4]